MHVTKPIDLALLAQELGAAGVATRPLLLYGTDADADVWQASEPDASGSADPEELPPEAVPVVEAHDASKPQRARAFEAAEDAERLALVAERSQVDPAFAALAELTLGKQGG